MSLSYTRSPGWLRGVQIGLGILVIALSIFALTFPAYMLYSLELPFSLAELLEYWRECWVTTHYGQAHFLSVWELAIIISIAVLVSPAFGAALGGVLIAIGLLITGIQMVASGIAGQRLRNPVSDIGR